MSSEQISFNKLISESSLQSPSPLDALSGIFWRSQNWSQYTQDILTGSFSKSSVVTEETLNEFLDYLRESPIQLTDISSVLSGSLDIPRTRHAEVTEQHNDTQALKKTLDKATEQLKPIFLTHLIEHINNAYFEFGFRSEVDEYLVEAFRQYGPLSRQWLEEIFNEQFDSPYNLCGILRTIAHFEYCDLHPQGMTIATAALAHTDQEVRECGIRCFENWEEPEALKILRNITVSENWLRDYLDEVIAYLEGIEIRAIAG
jgi:hypothetical protein